MIDVASPSSCPAGICRSPFLSGSAHAVGGHLTLVINVCASRRILRADARCTGARRTASRACIEGDREVADHSSVALNHRQWSQSWETQHKDDLYACLGRWNAGLNSPSTDAVERGRDLMEGILTCGNCHSPRGPGGVIDTAKVYSGGRRRLMSRHSPSRARISRPTETAVSASGVQTTEPAFNSGYAAIAATLPLRAPRVHCRPRLRQVEQLPRMQTLLLEGIRASHEKPR